jgi:site-specific DNA recombinase
MKSAILYARVSTDEQAEKGTSLDSQMDACRKYASSHGMEVIAEFKDDFTGSRIDRPELMKLIELITRRAADVVITYSSDRWARSTRVVLDLRDMLKVAETELHYVLGGKVEFSPEGELMDDTFSNFNVYWKAKIVEVTTRGKNTKARNGKLVMIGNPPYGYHKIGLNDTATLEIDEREAMVVQKIFEWYTTGNGTGMPLALRAIAIKLQEAGEPTPHYKKNSAKYWIPSTIHGIICNELYAGRSYYGKTRGTGLKRKKQDKASWITIEVPDLAIIDRSTFEAAQVRRVRNLEQSRRNRKNEYLLSGFFWCGACGSAMAGGCSTATGYKSLYYRCGNHWHKPEKEPCLNQTRTISTKKADVKVWEWLESLWTDPDKFDAGIMGIADRNRKKLEPMQKQLDRLQALIEKQDQKANRFIAQLGDVDDPELIAMVKTQAREAVTVRDQMKQEAEELKAVINKDVINPAMVERLRDLVTKIREGRARLNFEGKRVILNMLAVEVVFGVDETGRWLDVSCGLHPEVIGLCLS